MSAETIKKLGYIAKLKAAVTLATALEQNGIDPAAEDVSAAIGAAIAAGKTDAATQAKIETLDKLEAQAKTLEMDLGAIAAKDGALGDAIDTRARALLATGLAGSAPDPEVAAKAAAEKTASDKGKSYSNEPAQAYVAAIEAGDEEGASAIFAAHADKIIGKVTIVLPGE
jgi:hypothetical protein